MSQKLPTTQKTCLGCGTVFELRISPSKAATGRGKYCSKSCSVRATSTKHGHTTHNGQSRTYTSYWNMLARCYQPSNERYADYGGSGITVCQRWRDGFENFLADMGERPARTTIDRIDGSIGYSPENCRWASPTEQQRNLKNNVVLEYSGRSMCVSEWAKEVGLLPSVLSYRLNRGWPIGTALSTPAKFGNRVVK
jgi:hypothetical protein